MLRATLRTTRLPVVIRPFSSTPRCASKENPGIYEDLKDDIRKTVNAFKSTGPIGQKFEADGSVGSIGQKVGGPFSKDGVIGKQFTSKGKLGGTVDAAASKTEEILKGGEKLGRDGLGPFE
ncbi:hypothetical protein YB2330_003620 [Saitoella coloradoensis]